MNATAPALQATRRPAAKCSHCSKRAAFRIANAFQSSANGKLACRSNVCWGALTSGYPADGKPLV